MITAASTAATLIRYATDRSSEPARITTVWPDRDHAQRDRAHEHAGEVVDGQEAAAGQRRRSSQAMTKTTTRTP